MRHFSGSDMSDAVYLSSAALTVTVSAMCLQRVLLGHGSVNGRARVPALRGSKMHMISWLDMPDDVFFYATDATRFGSSCTRDFVAHPVVRMDVSRASGHRVTVVESSVLDFPPVACVCVRRCVT